MNGEHRSFRFGIELTPDVPVSVLSSFASAAEDAGFDAVFAASHYNNRDPFIALAQIAATTETVRLGPGVVNPYETHPIRLASQVATLSEVSDGRAFLGLGAGDRSTLSSLGIERANPLRAVLETIQIARRLWAGERVVHDGTFVAERAGLSFEVRQPPVFVGGQGPDMIRMAAKHADGVLINAAHPVDYEWATEQVEIGLDDRPEERGPFTVASFSSVSVADDADAAREAARPPVAFIVAGAPEAVLERHGLDAERAATIREALSSGDHPRAYRLVTPAMQDAFCVAGDRDDVAERVTSLLEYVDSFVAASPLGPDRETAIDHLGEVLASVDARGGRST